MTLPPPVELSVVVPAVNTLSDLVDCLDALDAQRGDVTLEAIVVNRLGPELHRSVEHRFPWAQTIDVPSHTTIPDMRAAPRQFVIDLITANGKRGHGADY